MTNSGSRKAAERSVRAGAVVVDGEVCTAPGRTVEPGSVIWVDPETVAAVHLAHMREEARRHLTAIHFEDDEVLVIEVTAGIGEQTLKSTVLPFLGQGDSHDPAPYRKVVSRAYKAMAGLVVIAKTPRASQMLNTLLSQREQREREARIATNGLTAPTGSAERFEFGVEMTFRGLVHGCVSGDISIRLPRTAACTVPPGVSAVGTDATDKQTAASTLADVERLRRDRSVTRVKVLGVTTSNSCGAITTIEATCVGHLNKAQHRILLAGAGHPIAGNVRLCEPIKRAKSGLYVALTGVRFPHPTTKEIIQITLAEPAAHAALLATERKFVEQKHARTAAELARLNVEHGVPALSRTGGGGACQPWEYAVGKKEFMGLPFKVDPTCLIPRQGSAVLVETAAAALLGATGTARDRQLRVLDLGVGSGCLLLALLHRLVDRGCSAPHGVGVDLSAPALAVARQNASDLGFGTSTEFVNGTFLAPFDRPRGAFDAILCNPPYLERTTRKLDLAVRTHEPAEALFVPGDDPLVHYREVCATVLREGILRPGTGVLIFEMPSNVCGQVVGLLEASGFTGIERHVDCRGVMRCVSARL